MTGSNRTFILKFIFLGSSIWPLLFSLRVNFLSKINPAHTWLNTEVKKDNREMAPGLVNNTTAICFTVSPKSCWRCSQGPEEAQNPPPLSGPDATRDIWGLRLTVLFSIRDTFLWSCPPQIYIAAAGQHARIHTVSVFGRGCSLIKLRWEQVVLICR